MPNLDFSNHMDRVMDAVGEETNSVKIINYEDSGRTDSRGETIWDKNEIVLERSLVELESSTFNRETQGAENLYDAELYVPLDTAVFEADSNHKSSEIQVNNKEYMVEQVDEQNGMIHLGCRRKR